MTVGIQNVTRLTGPLCDFNGALIWEMQLDTLTLKSPLTVHRNRAF